LGADLGAVTLAAAEAFPCLLDTHVHTPPIEGITAKAIANEAEAMIE
jgi:hypothetical protein